MDREDFKFTYRGVNVYRNARTGMYVVYQPCILRADTAAGIRQLITLRTRQ